MSDSSSVGPVFLRNVALDNQRLSPSSRSRPPPTAGNTMIAADLSSGAVKSCSMLRALYDDASQYQIVTESLIEVHTRNIRIRHNPKRLGLPNLHWRRQLRPLDCTDSQYDYR